MRHRHHTGHDTLGDGGMNDPDWDRVLVAPRVADGPPLGDPTRWGAVATVSLGQLGDFVTPQIIQAQCRDGFSRPWSIVGTVSADASVWAIVGIAQPFLEVQMGVGQAQVIHRINLSAVIAADAPYYMDALVPQTTKAFVIPGGLVGNNISIRAGWHMVAPIVLPQLSTFNLALTPFAAGTGL
jgi:hypothetical protein